jgi:hypothetical protein
MSFWSLPGGRIYKKMSDPGKYGMAATPSCKSNGFFKIQTVNLVQSAEALGTL